MSIKKFFYVFLALVYGWSITGQNDPQAENLLKQVEQKFNSYKNVTVDFSYKLHNPEAQIDEETNGKLIIQGNKYRGEYMGMIDLFDGKKRYLIVPELKEINIMSVSDEEEITPAKMFNFFREGYRFQMDIKQKLNGRLIQYVKLLPLKDNEIDYVYVGIDRKTKTIYRIIIVHKNKTRITLQVRKITPDKPMNDRIFQFDASKYPDYQINDLD